MEYGFLSGHPFVVVYLALFGIVFLRAQATYWLGRLLGAGLYRTRLGARIEPRLERSRAIIDRYGPPAVTASFLTIGLQTAVNATAGATRMRFIRYLIAMLAGCAAWAAIYSLGGIAILTAWWRAFTYSPALAIALLLALAIGVAWWAQRRRARDAI